MTTLCRAATLDNPCTVVLDHVHLGPWDEQ